MRHWRITPLSPRPAWALEIGDPQLAYPALPRGPLDELPAWPPPVVRNAQWAERVPAPARVRYVRTWPMLRLVWEACDRNPVQLVVSLVWLAIRVTLIVAIGAQFLAAA